MRLVRWLLVIPFALIVSIIVAACLLPLVLTTSPVNESLIATVLIRGLESISAAADRGEDWLLHAMDIVWRLLLLLAAMLVVPVVVTAILSEMLRFAGLFAQAALTGLLTAVLPFGVLRIDRLLLPTEWVVVAALFLVGAVTGFVYWAIAGRKAAPRVAAAAAPLPMPPLPVPPAQSRQRPPDTGPQRPRPPTGRGV